jgi:hypothetical protein
MPDESDRLADIAAAHATVADKIRALAAAGMPRADIARFLGKRYQHVRNVLEGDAQSGGGSGGGYVLGHADVSGVREQAAPYEPPPVNDDAFIEQRGPGVYWLRVRADGTLTLPAEYVAALNADPGHRVFTKLGDGKVTIESAETAMNRVREMVRKYAPAKSGSVVDEFLAERRAMWGEDD